MPPRVCEPSTAPGREQTLANIEFEGSYPFLLTDYLGTWGSVWVPSQSHAFKSIKQNTKDYR